MLSIFAQHYEHHMQSNEALKHEESLCHWCQIRSFSTSKKCPIYIINKVDNATLPKNFRFIEHSTFLPGVEPADDDFRAGCECADGRECQRAGCHCLQDMEVDPGDENRKIFMYHSLGHKKECLRGAFLESRQPIYECHSGCACSDDCTNRVVEKGRKVPLQIFRTDDGRGWGVRSTADIKRGQFVDRYLGEIMTAEEANNRRDASQVASRKDVYLFALDKFYDENSDDLRLRAAPYEVDGEFASGPTRFINHSCDPNLRSFARVGDHVDKPLHDLAFFAIKDIPAGTELTFDYVDGGEELVDDAHDPTKKKDMARCLCGSQDCRGYLW